MENLLIFFYILISVSLILIILLQQGKGSDIGSAFGGGSSNAMFGSSTNSNPLTKVTAVLSAESTAVTLVSGFEFVLDPNIALLDPPPKALPISDPFPCCKSIINIRETEIRM